MPTTITTLPTPPVRTSPSTFSERTDAFLGALPGFVTEANAVSTELNALAVTVNEQSLEVADAAAVVNVVKWVSGTTYAEGACVWSPVDFMTYRRKTASGSGTTDPSADTTNYSMIASIKRSGNYSTTLTVTGATNVTLPTSGTLAIVEDIASQAEAEAGTSAVKFMTPARTNFHPGVAKAWLKCGVSGNIQASHNITSVTDNGPGGITVTLNVDFSSADYVIAMSNSDSTAWLSTSQISSQTAGAFTISRYVSISTDASHTFILTPSDPICWEIACFGDQ